MERVKIGITVFNTGAIMLNIDAPVERVRCSSIVNDPGYETSIKTYEDEEEGILYDNLD